MKWFLSIAAVLILAAGLAAGLHDHFGVMWAACIATIGFLVTANLDRISEFKASRSGVEARTRELVTRAESTLTELQLLARYVAELSFKVIKRSGRWDPYSDDDEESTKAAVLNVLRKVGVDEADFPQLLKEWHEITEFDYAHAILGGSTIPDGVGTDVVAEWKQMREGGFAHIVAPDEIRAFLTKHGLGMDGCDEYLKDYEHYRVHGEHRRWEVWKEREHWGRLRKLKP